ncbi:MAG: ATP-binding protein [Actinomycetota bacterium]|nr:ATP-binding protein [Actinomycetota bacterium]
MITIGELRRVEQWMNYVRSLGLVFGIVGVTIQPNYPNPATRNAAWIVLTLLVVGSVAIWGALARVRGERDLERLGMIAFTFDILIIVGFVSVYAFQLPYVTWALLFLIPMEGALRYRLNGALFGAAVVALFFIAQTSRVQSIQGGPWDIATYVFVVGLSSLIAGVTGSMANNWHDQRRGFEAQSLKLIEVDKLKDRFLAVTSHEIRGPLTTIITGVDMIRRRDDRLTPDTRDSILEAVATQAQQLARLVDDLMMTSQLQSGQLAIHPEWSELEFTVEQALDGAAPRRRAHQLEVFVEPLRCEIDAARISQIIRNLVENAYKYTPDRTRVSITGKKSQEGISLQIADEGPGIPADKRDQLFEAFSRIEGTTSGQDGVGLGLFVVSHLVTSMGGWIDLTASSKGTLFSIYIPCNTVSRDRRTLSIVTPQGEAEAG